MRRTLTALDEDEAVGAAFDVRPGPDAERDRLEFRLAEAVELMNGATDPAERVTLYREICALRDRLGVRGCDR